MLALACAPLLARADNSPQITAGSSAELNSDSTDGPFVPSGACSCDYLWDIVAPNGNVIANEANPGTGSGLWQVAYDDNYNVIDIVVAPNATVQNGYEVRYAATGFGMGNLSAHFDVVAASGGTGTGTGTGGGGGCSGVTLTVPTGLVARPLNTAVQVSWTPVAAASGYNVYRSLSSSGSWQLLTTTPVTSSPYTDSSLNNGTVYYYYVTAVYSCGGESQPSTVVHATPALTAPGAPLSLTATAGNASVALSWTAPATATSYTLYSSQSYSGGYSTVASNITSASYTNSGLTNGIAYYYYVTATNSAGTGPASNVASATPEPPDFQFSATPKTVVVVPGQNTSYTLYVGSLYGFAGTTSFGVSGLPSGASASFGPATVTGTGTTVASVVVGSSVAAGATSAVTFTATSGSLTHTSQVNLAVSDFQVAVSPTSRSIALGKSRTFSIGITSTYGLSQNVALSVSGQPSGVTTSLSTASTTSGSILTVNVGTSTAAGTYTLTITGVCGSLTHTATLSLVVPSGLPPASITNLTAASGDSVIFLSWSAAPSAASYNIYRGTAAGQESSTPLATGVTKLSYVDATAVNDTTYYYTVTAISSTQAESDPSNEASATPEYAGAIRNLPGLQTHLLTADGTTNQGYDDCPDGSTPGSGPCSTAQPVNLGLALNFFGTSYGQVYVNNNGNLTFGQSLSVYTPQGLATSGLPPILAPFYADVDTRVGNITSYGNDTLQGHPVFGVDWLKVGYFFEHYDKHNTFQLVIIDRSDTGAGNFDFEYNYARIRWETGDASQGSNGFGGYPAHVGYSDGKGTAGSYFEFPGSGTTMSLEDSNNTTGLIYGDYRSTQPGRYRFSVRNGQIYSGTSDIVDDPPISTAPAAPVLSGTPGSGTATLTWTTPASAIGYNVYRTTTSGSGYIPIGATSANTLTDTGLTNGTTYYYVVTALNAYGESAYSNQVTMRPVLADFTLTASPPEQRVPQGGAASASIAVGSINGFTSSVTLTVAGMPTGLTASVTPSPATPAGTATLSVSAAATLSTGTYSLTVTGTSGTTTHTAKVSVIVAAAPTGGSGLVPQWAPVYAANVGNASLQAAPNLIDGAKGDTSTYYTANAVSATAAATALYDLGASNTAAVASMSVTSQNLNYNSAGYSVAYSSDGANWTSISGNGGGGGAPSSGPFYTSTYSPSSPVTARYWRWTMSIGGTSGSVALNTSDFRLFDASGNQVGSGVVLPAAPVLSGVAGSQQVALSWTTVSGAVSYNLYKGMSSGAETLYKNGLTSASFTDTGLTNGTTYWYIVTAVSSNGEGQFSNELSLVPAPAPAAPMSLAANGTTNQAAITWSSVSGAQSYNLYRGTSSGGESTTPIATGLTGTSYTDVNLTDATTYYYELAAVNGADAGGMSPEASTEPVDMPTGVTAQPANARIVISWQPVNGATLYKLYRYMATGGSGGSAYRGSLTTTSFSDGSLTNGTTYYYRVRACALNSLGNQSPEVHATPGPADFSLTATPAVLTIPQSGSGASTIAVTAIDGFTGTVSLTTSASTGLTASLSASSISTSGSSTLTVAAASTVAPGTYSVTVTSTSGSLTHTFTVSIQVTPPADFNLTAAPKSLTVAQGASGTSTLTVAPLNNFTGLVSFTTSNVPSGVTATVSPTSVTGSGAATLSIAATTTAAPGPYAITVTATSGSLTHTATINLLVTGQDYSLSASPATLTLSQGASGTTNIGVSALNGFAGSVTLNLSGLPAGVTSAFASNPVGAGGTSVLTLTAAPTAALGAATLTVTGVDASGNLVHSCAVSLTITAATISSQGSGLPQWSPAYGVNVGDASLQAAPNLVDGAAGDTSTYYTANAVNSSAAGTAIYDLGASVTKAVASMNVTSQELNNTSGGYAVSYSSDGANWTNISSNGGGGGQPSSTAPFYTATYPGNSIVARYWRWTMSIGGLSNTTLNVSDFRLFDSSGNQINGASSTADFLLQCTPEGLSIAPGANASCSLSAVAVSGFSGTIALAASGLPSGITATFTPGSVTAGGAASTVKIFVTSAVAVGSYTVTLTGVSGSLTHSVTFPVSVVKPDFALAASPASLTIPTGSSAQSEVMVNALAGFTGSVSLTTSGAPEGVTTTLGSSSVAAGGQTALKLAVSNSATAGTSTITVTGASGSLTRSATVALTVQKPDFSLTASPSSFNLGAGGSASSTITVGALSGFTGTVSLTASGQPSGSTVAFTPTSIATSGTSTLAITLPSTVSVGTYYVTVTGTSGSLTHTATVTLIVGAGDFSIVASASSLIVDPGKTVSVGLTVTPINNLTSPVTLTFGNIPSSIVPAFSTDPVSLSGTTPSLTTLTLTVNGNIQPGTYNLPITAQSAFIMHSLALTLKVNTVVLTSLNLDAESATSGYTGTGTVTVNGIAPQNVTIPLTSNSTSVTVPTSVTIASGALSGQFTYSTNAVVVGTGAAVTANYFGVSQVASIDVVPAIDLTATATGSKKVTLFWLTLPNATSYNIYRSTTSGSAYQKIANTAGVADSAPGATNMLMYTDTSPSLVDGTAYYYYVAAVNSSSAEFARSEEDSATPGSGAIPWDTGNAATITNAISTNIGGLVSPDIDQDGDTYPATLGTIVVCGPDGVMYQSADADGNAPSAYAPSEYYNASLGEIVDASGNPIMPVPDLGYGGATGSQPPNSSAQLAASRIHANDVGAPLSLPENTNYQYPSLGGPIQKIESEPGYDGISSIQVWAPSPHFNSSFINLDYSHGTDIGHSTKVNGVPKYGPNGYSQQGYDTAWMYMGGGLYDARLANNPAHPWASVLLPGALDAGITLASSNPSTDPGWNTSIQGGDPIPVGKNNPFPGVPVAELYSNTYTDLNGQNPKVPAGDKVRVLFYPDDPDQPLIMSFGSTANSNIYVPDIVWIHVYGSCQTVAYSATKTNAVTGRPLIDWSGPMRLGGVTVYAYRKGWDSKSHQGVPALPIVVKRCASIAQNIGLSSDNNLGDPGYVNGSFMLGAAFGGYVYDSDDSFQGRLVTENSGAYVPWQDPGTTWRAGTYPNATFLPNGYDSPVPFIYVHNRSPFFMEDSNISASPQFMLQFQGPWAGF